MKHSDNNLHIISVPYLHGFEILDENKIMYLKGEGNQTAIYVEGKPEPLIANFCLRHYEKNLPRNFFIRIHKSYIINLNYLKKYIKGKFSHVVLKYNICLNVSLSYRDKLLDFLGGIS